MSTYLFILGRQPVLSVAELSAVSDRKPILLAQGAIAKLELNLTRPQDFLDQLGGSVKLAEILGSYQKPTDLLAAMMTALPQTTKKLFFGISLFGSGSNYARLATILRWGKQLKKTLKASHRPARFVTSREPLLSSVIVSKNHLLHEAGREFVVVAEATHFLLAQTVAVQDFKAYSRRDYGRPERDPRRGSLPPKLAQIMLNLAQVRAGNTVYDPFCGQGTILQEALLKGARAIGSDRDVQATMACRANLQWLAKHDLCPDPRYQLFTQDATRPDPALKTALNTAVAVVTEGTLGPPQSRPLSEPEARKRWEQTFGLISKILATARPHLKPTSKIVFCLPLYRLVQGWYEPAASVKDKLASLGYTIAASPLDYSRPDQIVGRQIWQLRPRP